MSLKQKYADFFPIGAAVAPWHLENQADLLHKDFNHLTAENAMKFGPIHPEATNFSTEDADAIAGFARNNGMKMTGHTLVWHNQQPAWLFEGLTAGHAPSIDLLKARLQAHTQAMVTRYGDVVDNWDVVNEAISDDPKKTWRDGSEHSKWYEIFGSEEYVYWAFVFARDALEARAPGSSAGKLYYNDYNEPQKIDRILELSAWLENRGIRLDGIGLQAHWRLDWPSVSVIQRTIDKVVASGLKLKISELDISVYDDYPAPDRTFKPAPEVAMSAALEVAQAERYGAIYELFRENAKHITSVTTWGTSDDQSWLHTFPIPRRNYPLLWNDEHSPKLAYAAIVDF